MTKERVTELVKKYASQFERALYVNDWEVNINVGRIAEENVVGTCNRDQTYRKATITLDNEKLDDEKDFMRVLLHEYLHIVISDFDLYKAGIDDQFDKDGVLSGLYFHCVERCVGQLERVLASGLGITPYDIVKKSGES